MSGYKRDILSGGLRVVMENPTEEQKQVIDDTNALLSLGGKYERDNKVNSTGKAYNSLINLIISDPEYWKLVEKQIFQAVYKYTDNNNSKNWNFSDNDISYGVLHLLETVYTEKIFKEKKISYMNLKEVRKLLKRMDQIKEYTISSIENEFKIK